MLVEVGGILPQQFVIPLSRVRNRAAAEVQRSTRRIKYDLDAGRIVELLTAADGSCESSHHGLRIIFQELNHEVDGWARNFRFISLHVYENIDIRHLPRQFRNPVRTALRFRVRELDTPPKAAYFSGLYFKALGEYDEAI